MRTCEKNGGYGCLVPCGLMKLAGVVMIAAGALLALIFIPIRLWLALLGAALAAAGVLLVRLS